MSVVCTILFELLLQVTPPFIPQVRSETDTRYFDEQFTREPPIPTSPSSQNGPTSSHRGRDGDLPHFEQFSYHRGSHCFDNSPDFHSDASTPSPK